MGCSSVATATFQVPSYVSPTPTYFPQTTYNNGISEASSFSGSYGVSGVGGNSSSGGEVIQPYNGGPPTAAYWFATNKYIDTGNAIPVGSIQSLTMGSYPGVGEYTTTLVPATFYVSADGSDWIGVGTASGTNQISATITVSHSQLVLLGVSSIRYFRCSGSDVVNTLTVTIN
jgi:hypothetical protein